MSELASLKGVLKNIRDDVNSERSYVKRLDADRKEILERLLKSIFTSLRKTQDLVTYFRSLGNDEEGLQVWKRMRWLNKRGEILRLIKQVTAESTRLQLCMSDINNASLARIEFTIEEALNKPEPEMEDEEVEPLVKAPTSSSTRRESDLLSISMPRRRFTEKTSGEKTLVNTIDYPSSLSGDSEAGNAPQMKISRQVSIPIASPRRHPSLSVSTYAPPSPSSDDGYTAKDQRLGDNGKGLHNESSPRGLLIDLKRKSTEFNMTPETSVLEPDNDFAAAIDTAKEELSRVRQQERQARPLRLPDRGLFPDAPDRLMSEFQQSLKTELEYRYLSTRDWLRIGTWWLLKTSFRLEALERTDERGGNGSLSSSGKSSLAYVQSYVDLVKATWILFECILKSDYVIPMHSDENRKLFKDLEDVSSNIKSASNTDQ